MDVVMRRGLRAAGLRRKGRSWCGAVLVHGLLLLGTPLSGQELGQDDAPMAVPATLTLDEAVEAAVRRNPELDAARWELEQAREQVDEAWGNVFPTADLSSSYTRNLSVPVSFLPAIIFDPDAPADELIAVQFGADNLWNFSVDFEQPLFNAAAFIGVGAAGRFESLQEEVLRGRLHTVVTRVRTAYYQALLSQEQERLLENSVRRVEESLRETQALAEAGLSSEYDVLRLEVELANLRPNLRRANNAVLQAKRQLGVELRIDPGEAESVEVAGSLANMDLDDFASNSADNQSILALSEVATAPADDLVASAMAFRSDVRQLEQTEDLRHTELRVQQVEYLPQVTIFGNYGIVSQQNGSPEFFGDPRAYNRLIGVRVSWPLFTGFRRDARIDRQRALLQQARVQSELGRNQVASEVRNVVDQVDEARERASAQQLAVTQAERGFAIASAQYREGIGSQLELTDAEVALRQSEFNYAQAVYDYLVARAQLDAAVGLVPGDLPGAEGGA